MNRRRQKRARSIGRGELVEYAHEQLAIWEALRRFGFPADDIYAAFYNGNELFTTLRADGKEWNVSISHTRKVSPGVYIPVYTAECERWNAAKEEDGRREIFTKYMPVPRMIQIAMSLRSKDILIPNLPDAPPAEDIAVLQAYMEGRLVIVDDDAHDEGHFAVHLQTQPN
jgi:hypothetical protein